MSRLYYSEAGRVIPALCEELTAFRRARKGLRLPATGDAGQVYVLARSYPNNEKPLRMAVNGEEAAAIEPARPAYYWYEVPVAADRLVEGENTFAFWTDSTAMNSWSLALEPGHAEPESSISDDEGKTWRNEQMAYLNAVRGEYVVRVRLAEGEDPAPPSMVWEDQGHPKLGSLRKILPPVARDQGPLLKRVRALSAWLASSWEHTNSMRAAQYGPWDAETILAWGAAQDGHNGKRPVVMCVHYAAAFVSCAQAVGIPARCAVLTEAVNGSNGHFVTGGLVRGRGQVGGGGPECGCDVLEGRGATFDVGGPGGRVGSGRVDPVGERQRVSAHVSPYGRFCRKQSGEGGLLRPPQCVVSIRSAVPPGVLTAGARGAVLLRDRAGVGEARLRTRVRNVSPFWGCGVF